MPPKGSVKAKGNTNKAQAPKEPSTPKSKPTDDEDTPKQTPKSGSATKPRVRKATKETGKPFHTLSSTIGDAAPIDVSYENDTVNGKQLSDVGGYGQNVKLRALQPFSLYTSVMIQEGEYAGYQALLLKPSKPFPFLEVPKIVRARIYRYYFAPHGKISGKIEINHHSNRPVAKAYAAEAKPRLGLLRVNKEICEEARPILYSFTLKFDKAETVLSFLTCAGEKVRSLLLSIDIITYGKATAMPTMTMLSECRNLRRVHIVGGVGVSQTPEKAAKQFYTDAHRFLQVMGTLHGDKCAAIDMLSFGNKCFTVKDDDNNLVEWDEDDVDEFTDALKKKLL